MGIIRFSLMVIILVVTKSIVYAGNQKESQLAVEVQSELHTSIINPIKPHLVFDSPKEAALWLDDMSERLKRFAKSNPILASKDERKKLLTIIQYESVRAELDPQMVLSLITIESNFNGNVVSQAGAIGLMQVMPFWQDQIGTLNQSLLNMQTNIRYGCTILRYYLQLEHGDLFKALGRYNGSRGETKYPTLVFNAYERYWRFGTSRY